MIAAVAAASSGAKTLLVERFPFLGGNGTAGLMTCYNGFRNQRPPEALQSVKGIPAEYIAELLRLGGVTETTPYSCAQHNVHAGDLPYCIGFDAEAAKVASLNLLKNEGVTLRLHSWIVGPMMKDSSGHGSGCGIQIRPPSDCRRHRRGCHRRWRHRRTGWRALDDAGGKGGPHANELDVPTRRNTPPQSKEPKVE